jgi:sugar phosphate isomerase/epimerase
VGFIYRFPERIFHVHMKDVWWSDTPREVGVFGGHTTFGDPRRYWNFRSLGRGKINFEEIIRALNYIDYQGPLSIEWEDSAMDREHGARESCAFTKRIDFEPSTRAFDAGFSKD